MDCAYRVADDLLIVIVTRLCCLYDLVLRDAQIFQEVSLVFIDKFRAFIAQSAGERLCVLVTASVS